MPRGVRDMGLYRPTARIDVFVTNSDPTVYGPTSRKSREVGHPSLIGLCGYTQRRDKWPTRPGITNVESNVVVPRGQNQLISVVSSREHSNRTGKELDVARRNPLT
jgi:hypothetical protein